MGYTISEILKAFFVPSLRTDIYVKGEMVAPYEPGTQGDQEKFNPDVSSEDADIDHWEVNNKYSTGFISPFDRIITWAVKFAGSIFAFVLMWVVLIIWIVLGAVYHAPQVWQIVMQDGQSIQSYLWDTLLMRNQLDDHTGFMELYGRLKSRYLTHQRLIGQIEGRRPSGTETSIDFKDKGNGEYDAANSSQGRTDYDDENIDDNDVDDEHREMESSVTLRDEGWYDKLSSKVSKIVGSLWSSIIYWVGVFIWVGCGALVLPTGDDGPYTGETTGSNPRKATWSDNWQMYINTAVAVVIMFTSVFLANIRYRNDRYVEQELNSLCVFDCKIERMDRYLTGDMVDNEIVKVPAIRGNKLQTVISVYSEIIATGIGLMITCCFFGAWIGCGHLMDYNDNWWLIMGTYTGLVGFFDGFVLRNVYKVLTMFENDKYMELLTDSQSLLETCGIHYQLRKPHLKKTLAFRISYAVSMFVSSQTAVILSLVIIIALVALASGFHWNETFQLVANTPTMIIEGWCLIILIEAQNWVDYKRRFVLKQLAVSRKLIYAHLESKIHDQDGSNGAGAADADYNSKINNDVNDNFDANTNGVNTNGVNPNGNGVSASVGGADVGVQSNGINVDVDANKI